MVNRTAIKKISAAVLLLVFSFSITPTILLHNWLADHTDTAKKYGPTGQQQVSAKKFYCDCNNIVAESPFTETDEASVPAPLPVFCIKQGAHNLHSFSSPHFYFSLRGPPAV